LAAQLATSPHLGCGVIPNPIQAQLGGSPYTPDHIILDRWFKSLVNRAEWLLESANNQRVRFENIFELDELYSYTAIAKKFKDVGVGPPWNRGDQLRKKLMEIDTLVVEYYAVQFAASILRHPIERTDKFKGQRNRYVKKVVVLLGNYSEGIHELKEKLVKLAPSDCVEIRQEGDYNPKDENKLDQNVVYRCENGCLSFKGPGNDLPRYFIEYCAASKMLDRLTPSSASKGGRQSSVDIDASTMFKSVRCDGLPQELWSYLPD